MLQWQGNTSFEWNRAHRFIYYSHIFSSQYHSTWMEWKWKANESNTRTITCTYTSYESLGSRINFCLHSTFGFDFFFFFSLMPKLPSCISEHFPPYFNELFDSTLPFLKSWPSLTRCSHTANCSWFSSIRISRTVLSARRLGVKLLNGTSVDWQDVQNLSSFLLRRLAMQT